MKFVRILEDARLWAVIYDGEKDNCFDALFSQWFDIGWLKSFFQNNLSDLASFFRITYVYQAVMDTIDEASQLECLMLEAIKLTAKMTERSHTLAELAKLEHVRNHLIDNGVFDVDSLIDYYNEQSN